MGPADEQSSWPRPFTPPDDADAEARIRRARTGIPVATTPVMPGEGERPLRISTLPPGRVLLPADSKLGRAAVWMSILRDLLIIIFLIAVMVGAGVLTSALRRSGGSVRNPAPSIELPCPSPTADSWGTFCPQAPGG